MERERLEQELSEVRKKLVQKTTRKTEELMMEVIRENDPEFAERIENKEDGFATEINLRVKIEKKINEEGNTESILYLDGTPLVKWEVRFNTVGSNSEMILDHEKLYEQG